MINPWLILAVVVALGVSFAAGEIDGTTRTGNRIKAEQAAAVNQAVSEANEAAALSTHAAILAEQRRADYRVQAAKNQRGLTHAIAENSNLRACVVDADVIGLLNAAVDAANADQTATASGGNGAVPAPAERGPWWGHWWR